MDPKKADEEVANGLEVDEIILTHRAVRKSLKALWGGFIIMIFTSVSVGWEPGAMGGAVGVVLAAVCWTLHDKKKIR